MRHMGKIGDGVSVGALLRRPVGGDPPVENPYRDMGRGRATNAVCAVCAVCAATAVPDVTSEQLLASISKMMDEVIEARVSQLEAMVTIFKTASVGRTEDVMRSLLRKLPPAPFFVDELREEYFRPSPGPGPGPNDVLGALMMMNEIAASTRRGRNRGGV